MLLETNTKRAGPYRDGLGKETRKLRVSVAAELLTEGGGDLS